ncbi:MAG: hypothetical protein ACRDRN_00765 [Sciscionella sp.]
MTYPPQQPGPYGQQDPDDTQPMSGAYPATAGQPRGGAGESGQTMWFGAPGGNPGGEPPKKKTGLRVGVSAVAVVIVALLVTGLAAPGWMLTRDAGTSTIADGGGARSGGAPSSATTVPPRTSGNGDATAGKPSGGTDPASGAGTAGAPNPAAAANEMAQAYTTRDAQRMIKVACSLPKQVSATELQKVLDAMPKGAKFEIAGTPKVSGNRATATMTASAPGVKGGSVSLPMAESNGTWCVAFAQMAGGN